MQHLPDTLQVIERGWLSSNHVVFAEDDVPTVVDTGYVTEGEGTRRLIGEALRGRRLGRIVNTHLHSDHAGGQRAVAGRARLRDLDPAGRGRAGRDLG